MARRSLNVIDRHRDLLMRHRLPLASAISAILAGVPMVYAATEAETGGLQEIVVTAQKKTENLQDVPISIQALGAEKLEQLHIENIDDYVKFLPGVTTVKGLGQGGNGVGTTHVYMRGVVSGQDGNHSASQPSVGTYFDEQPVTTIDGTIDLHMYDIQRVEVLEGPQGTLYGASSEAGTIRVITNKPDPSKFAAGYDVSGNSVDHGGIGYSAEGFVNLPLSPIAAVRLVGWDQYDAGYIDNVAGTNASAGIVDGVRTFPTSGATLSNAGSVQNNYNYVTTRGGRAALRLELGDWTVTPTFMGQSLNGNGFFGYDPAVGDLKLVHFGPERTNDSFTQAALTIEGKVSDFDIVYAGAWLVRNAQSIADYSDYSYFYDKYYGSGAFWTTAAGGLAEPQEFVVTRGHYTKWSNELRVSTPQQYPVKGTVGLFAQRQVHEIWEQYVMPGADYTNVYGNPAGPVNPNGFDNALSIPGIANSIWLTDEERVDRDSAAFGQVTWDIDPSWSLTGGVRFFKANNSLQGFYGYSAAYQAITGYHSGQEACGPPGASGQINYAPFHGAPCTDLNQDVKETGHTQRISLAYKFDRDRMVYATYSTGFRPGGVNRVYDADIKALYPPYAADYLKNYEIGWKTLWFDRQLRWNGALFYEDWNNFQFSFLGPNSVTVVQNAANAKIKGVETEVEWAVTEGLVLSAAATFLDAKLTTDFCGTLIPGTTTLQTSCPAQVNSFADGTTTMGPLAVSGESLPVAPKIKANAVARYSFALMDWKAFVQGAFVHQGSSEPLLRLVDREHLGELPAFNIFDLSTGVAKNGLSLQLLVTNVFDERAELTRFAQCTPTTCTQNYVIPTQPRTIVLKFGQRF
ncbi:MAG TPA: TonB-dependent receptor [Steroidobacteraceae bacterium]|nr:TonB-dependent receptor [Steroidobacteraceae bacterium]